MSRRRAKLLEKRQHLSTEDQVRRAALPRRDFHVLPANSTTPAGLQCFQGSFFCSEARGIMLRRHYAATVAIYTVGGGENAISEPWRAYEHFANSRDFDNVYANGNNHKRSRINSSGILLARN